MPRLVVRFKKFSQIRKWEDAARRLEIGDTTQSTELWNQRLWYLCSQTRTTNVFNDPSLSDVRIVAKMQFWWSLSLRKNALEIVYWDFLKRFSDSWFCILLLQWFPSELSLAACDIPCYSFSLFIFSLLYMLNFVAYKSTHSNSYFTLINCKHIRNFRPAQQVETSFILAKYQYRKYP